MSEGMEQFGGPTSSRASLEAAAKEFRARVEEAAGRLSGAAQQFVTMSDGLLAAVTEAREAAERAEAARKAVEETRERIARDYGNVSELVRDLQTRIAALAVLSQPLAQAAEPAPAPEAPAPVVQAQPVGAGYGSPGESSW